jgi:hypothetical protein
MAYYLLKLLISAVVIVVVSEVAKLHPGLGALIKSLPLVSILAMIWLWIDTHDAATIGELSTSTFWLVLPTLPMFLVLPALLRHGWRFPGALAASVGVMLVCYLIAVPILGRFGITI